MTPDKICNYFNMYSIVNTSFIFISHHFTNADKNTWPKSSYRSLIYTSKIHIISILHHCNFINISLTMTAITIIITPEKRARLTPLDTWMESELESTSLVVTQEPIVSLAHGHTRYIGTYTNHTSSSSSSISAIGCYIAHCARQNTSIFPIGGGKAGLRAQATTSPARRWFVAQ